MCISGELILTKKKRDEAGEENEGNAINAKIYWNGQDVKILRNWTFKIEKDNWWLKKMNYCKRRWFWKVKKGKRWIPKQILTPVRSLLRVHCLKFKGGAEIVKTRNVETDRKISSAKSQSKQNKNTKATII